MFSKQTSKTLLSFWGGNHYVQVILKSGGMPQLVF